MASLHKMSKGEISTLQNRLNKFIEARPSLGYTSLFVDGDAGDLTYRLLRDVKYELGYLKTRGGEVDDRFYWRLAHPRRAHKSSHKQQFDVSRKAVRLGIRRRIIRRKNVIKNRINAVITHGVSSFDGVPVAKDWVPRLQWARTHGWRGKLVSGWRSPAYSESLCYRICGRPSCSGTCAGRSSRHSQDSVIDGAAVDVSDYINFGHVIARYPHAPRLFNALPRDRVHFSRYGN